MVTNIHARNLHAPLHIVSAMLDSLASKQDQLWPFENWPPMMFDRPLGIGAVGGHGKGRYIVESYEPGHYIRFRFTAPKGFIGTHCFSVKEINPGVVQLKHEINMELEGLAKLGWLLAVRWLHDALLEDALDKAETAVTAHPVRTSWSLWVRFLRYIYYLDEK